MMPSPGMAKRDAIAPTPSAGRSNHKLLAGQEIHRMGNINVLPFFFLGGGRWPGPPRTHTRNRLQGRGQPRTMRNSVRSSMCWPGPAWT